MSLLRTGFYVLRTSFYHYRSHTPACPLSLRFFLPFLLTALVALITLPPCHQRRYCSGPLVDAAAAAATAAAVAVVPPASTLCVFVTT
jgi:hypothetical protein